MFGKRSETPQGIKPAAKPVEQPKAQAAQPAPAAGPATPVEQHKTEAPSSAANTRMERARRRIWTDLRDGVDLKSLSRMDGEAARAEILSAVQEIGQFRGLDVNPAELA